MVLLIDFKIIVLFEKRKFCIFYDNIVKLKNEYIFYQFSYLWSIIDYGMLKKFSKKK